MSIFYRFFNIFNTITLTSLWESVRTENRVSQRVVLNLGSDFSLSKENWKVLAKCIEQILYGHQPLFFVPYGIEKMVQSYAARIIQKQDYNNLDSDDIIQYYLLN